MATQGTNCFRESRPMRLRSNKPHSGDDMHSQATRDYSPNPPILRVIRNKYSFETILTAANHAAFKSSTCPCACAECVAMSPNLDTLCAAAVMPSSAVCSGPTGRDSVVSDSTERKSKSECEPMPRSPAISRIETRPVPSVLNFARPKW